LAVLAVIVLALGTTITLATRRRKVQVN
jgi:hypothetical protein